MLALGEVEGESRTLVALPDAVARLETAAAGLVERMTEVLGEEEGGGVPAWVELCDATVAGDELRDIVGLPLRVRDELGTAEGEPVDDVLGEPDADGGAALDD